MIGSGAVSGCEKSWLERERSGSGAGARDGGAGNGAGIGSHRNWFELCAEILPLPLRSHALAMASRRTALSGNASLIATFYRCVLTVLL